MTATPIDVSTLDLIENALLNARFEMDEVVRRAAMSPTIRVQHDEFPMICNARGQMVVGQFGSSGEIRRFLQRSTTARCCGSTTVVASYCSTIAYPANAMPGSSAARA